MLHLHKRRNKIQRQKRVLHFKIYVFNCLQFSLEEAGNKIVEHFQTLFNVYSLRAFKSMNVHKSSKK